MSLNHSIAYRSDIDGLRAIAVLLVVGFHAFPEHIRSGLNRANRDDALEGRFRTCKRVRKGQFKFQ